MRNFEPMKKTKRNSKMERNYKEKKGSKPYRKNDKKYSANNTDETFVEDKKPTNLREVNHVKSDQPAEQPQRKVEAKEKKEGSKPSEKTTPFKARTAKNGKVKDGGYIHKSGIVTTSKDDGKRKVSDKKPMHKPRKVKKVVKKELYLITQKDTNRFELKPVITNTGIPAVWDYNDGKRIRIVCKANGSKKIATYINKKEQLEFRGLIPISRSNLIVDYFVETGRFILYKVINNSVSSKKTEVSADNPIVVIPYNRYEPKTGWKTEPFDTIKELFETVKAMVTNNDTEGYFIGRVIDSE